jgi:hypothetical protein
MNDGVIVAFIGGLFFVLSFKRSIELDAQQLETLSNLVELRKEINAKLREVLTKLKRTSESDSSAIS